MHTQINLHDVFQLFSVRCMCVTGVNILASVVDGKLDLLLHFWMF